MRRRTQGCRIERYKERRDSGRRKVEQKFGLREGGGDREGGSLREKERESAVVA